MSAAAILVVTWSDGTTTATALTSASRADQWRAALQARADVLQIRVAEHTSVAALTERAGR